MLRYVKVYCRCFSTPCELNGLFECSSFDFKKSSFRLTIAVISSVIGKISLLMSFTLSRNKYRLNFTSPPSFRGSSTPYIRLLVASEPKGKRRGSGEVPERKRSATTVTLSFGRLQTELITSLIITFTTLKGNPASDKFDAN
jgi:hypothetical protein